MSIADAVSRRRKKQRIEEMERAESEEDQRELTGPRAGAEEWEWEGSGSDPRGEAPHGAPSAGAGAGSGAPKGEGPRETADTLVPDDLWAILTGQTPQQRQSPPPPRAPSPPSESQSKAEREFEELTTQPWRAGPEREEAAPAPSPTTSAPVPPSRPKQAPRPVAGRTGRPVPGQRMGRKPLPSRDPMSAPSGRFPSPPRTGSQSPRPAPEMAGVRLQSITAGEIGSEGGSFSSPLRREIGAPAIVERRSTGGASSYVSDLRTAGREGLRKAIVLQEVLGPPVSLKPAEKRVWEAWDE